MTNPSESKFRLIAKTQAEEDEYDFVKERAHASPSGLLGSIMNMVKGALGGGVLSVHVAYKKAGFVLGGGINIIFGVYMTYCLYILVLSAQILYKRTRVHTMSYADVGEAAFACHPNPKVSKWAKTFRYTIDTIICIDLFGACACYQIIIAKSLKQLVENVQETSLAGRFGYPDLRVYMALLIPVIILICLITQLKWIAPFSLLANAVILFALGLTIYYCTQRNPTLIGMNPIGKPYNILEALGMIVFSMSCCGVVIPIENNMKKPSQYPLALAIGMAINISCLFIIAMAGYGAFLEKSESPITINFPMTTVPKITKVCIAAMIYVTHAVNFWAPFNLCFYYIQKRVKENNRLKVELLCRAAFVTMIGIIAIIFPTIDALMGFLGAFCLSNMGFIWPVLIELLVISHRPGFGKFNWRLWRSLFLMLIALIILIIATGVNLASLIRAI